MSAAPALTALTQAVIQAVIHHWGPIALNLASGILGVLLTLGAAGIRDRRKRKQEGRFTALTLALLLEDYTAKCISLIYDTKLYDDAPEQFSMPKTYIPETPVYSERTNWNSIGLDLTSQVLTFKGKIDSSKGYISSVGIGGDAEDMMHAAAEEATELGVVARQIAKTLRKKFKLPPQLLENFNSDEFLATELGKVRAYREKFHP